ncbi:MAG TPA: glycosyltransferase family 2 protein [Verrucomicrobiota bacterium]|nr:glycosyltransferase family 2 protein [Verrucomicrobiota bacterium]
MKRCVIIPAYNEEQTIPLVIRDIREHCQDIVVVDDGSTDFTGAVARDEGAMVIPHGQNKGYAEALRTGYRYALEQNYDGIVQIDADGQHDPGHIPELFRRGQSWDVVIGSRFLGRQKYESPLSKAVGVRIFRHIIHNETGLQITDPTSGYRFMDRRAFTLTAKITCNYPDANMIILMHRLGLTITETPVRMQPNAAGKSMHKGKLIKYIREVFRSITMEMKCRT